jgi:hypothetical protein
MQIPSPGVRSPLCEVQCEVAKRLFPQLNKVSQTL